MSEEPFDPAESGSLSFVDVLANGMGSMLVLFILMTLLRATADFGAVDQTTLSSAGGSGDQVGGGNEPFVILVTSQPKTQLFAPIGGKLRPAAEAWQCDANYKSTARLNVGANYATFYGPSPPSNDETIRLTGLNPNAVILIRIYRGSGELPIHTAKVDGGEYAVWPAPVGKAGDR